MYDNIHIYIYIYIYIRKAVPMVVWIFPEDSRELSFPHFMKTAQDIVKVVSLKHRQPLTPGYIPGLISVRG